MSSALGLADLESIFQTNTLCNELGLDPTSLGFTLSMAMECVEKGILTEAGIGQPLRFGQPEAVLTMIPKITYREGFGDILAEGAQRAAARIGGGAERYALHVKGLEMVCFEPRTQTNLALGYATAPIGPRYDICEHDWDYDTDDLCIFAIAPTRVLRVADMARLLSAVTGWDSSAYELMRFGERRLHLMRVYNLREGLTAADDTLPARFFYERDGPILAAGKSNGAIDLWDGVTRHILTGHSGPVTRPRWSEADQLLLSLSDDGTIRVWGPS
jgi:aldehyde:ferredoxin oxidoreductase